MFREKPVSYLTECRLLQVLALITALYCSTVLSSCSASYDTHHVDALKRVSEGAMLIDVRSAEEFAQGHLVGAINISHTEVVPQLVQRDVDPSREIVVYCRSGNRSGQAQTALRNAGFSRVINGGALSSLQAAANDPSSQRD